MRKVTLMMGVFCGLMALASPAAAQTCASAPSFRDQPYQVGLTASFTDDAVGVGGHFAAGGQELFAGGSVGALNFNDADATAITISAFGGADFATTFDDRIYFCPLGAIGFTTGPDIGGVEVSNFSIEGGGSVGIIVAQNDDMVVIPSFGISIVYTHTTLELAGVDSSNNDGSGRAIAGVGFIFNQNLGIITSVAVPFSVPSSDPIFSVRLTYGFGR